MREAANIIQVSSLKPDYMGFIFFEKSPRFVGPEFRLPEEFPPPIGRIGVFVNASTEEIMKWVVKLGLTGIQLHGKESTDQCLALKNEGLQVIKVFSVDDTMDFHGTRAYEEAVDYFLFDTKGKYYGGNATVFDWNVLTHYDQRVPFFLSGGLTPANIDEVEKLKGMNLYGLDMNSGVEESPGFKSVAKIQQVLHSVNKIFS